MQKSDFSSLFEPEIDTTSSSDFSSLFSQEKQAPLPTTQSELPSTKQEIIQEPQSNFWDTFGQGLAYQMKSGGPSGAPSLSPEQAKEVGIDVGTQALVGGVFAPLKYLASLSRYAPRALQFITGLTQSGVTGASIPTAKALINGDELPTQEELLKEGALWAGIDLTLQALHLGASFGSTVNKLSKETGLPRREVISRIWNGAKNYYGWGEPKIDPETGVKIIPPEQIEGMTKFAEREVETLSGKAERVPEEKAVKEQAQVHPSKIQPEVGRGIEREISFPFVSSVQDPWQKQIVDQNDHNIQAANQRVEFLEKEIRNAKEKGLDTSLYEIDLEDTKKRIADSNTNTQQLKDEYPEIFNKKDVVSELLEEKPVEQKNPKLTKQQIRVRKISEAEQKKIKTRNAEELKERKDQAEKERVVAFKAMGIVQAKEAAPEIKAEVIPDNSDSTELEEVLEETLSPNDTLRAQATAEAQHMRDKIVGKLNGIWAKFDVEAPFKAVSAPKTGKAVKLFYDTKNAFLEEAKGIVKNLQALKLTPDQLWDSFLAAESGAVLPSPEMNKARDIFQDYFDKSFSKLKEEGVLALPWPQSAISRLEQTISDLQTKLTAPNIKKQAEGKIEKEILEIRKTISLLKGLKYIPKSASLITQALAEVLPDIEPKTLRKFAIAAHRKRTSGALADWVASQPQIREVLHPYDFIGNYANRKGTDIALLRIANNAIDEGLASKGDRLGFKMQPGEFPALDGYTLHPALYEYLKNLTNPLPFNVYDKISRWAKASVVFDPTYLGTLIPYFRTLIQNPSKLFKLPKYWKKAVQDLLNKTPDYLEFLEKGGASNPYPEVRDFETWLEVEKLKNASPEQILFQHVLTKDGAIDLFNKMANFSWMVDRLARLAYYNLLIDKGFSTDDAAKLAAENFVDYNKLPAKTRRWMGRIFFAPATQVLSIIQDVVMASAPIKLSVNFFKDKESFNNDNVNKERIRLLVGTIMVLATISQLMKMWGFKEEEFGTRYVSEYEDENGKKKEVVISMTHPLNYTFRWVNTFWRGFGPGETSPSQKLWGRLTGQLGPVPNMIRELGDNKDRNGKKIWDPIGDNYSTAFWKVSKYILSHIEPFGIQKFHTSAEKKAARQAVKDRMGWAEWFMDSIQFIYDRKTQSERVNSRIRNLKSQMNRLAKTGELTEDAKKRYEDAINELALTLDDK